MNYILELKIVVKETIFYKKIYHNQIMEQVNL